MKYTEKYELPVFEDDDIVDLIEYTDELTEKLENATNKQDKRINDQIKNMTLTDPSSAEIIDARGNHDLLKDRLNAGDEKVEEIENRLDVSDEEIQEIKTNLEDTFINEIKQTKSFRDTESNTTYYITEIPYKDKKGNILKPQIGIANDDKTFSSGLESNISFASRKNATVSINGTIFNTNTLKPKGIIIQNKQILWNEQLEDVEILAFKDDGILITYNASLFTAQQLIDDGVVNAVTGWYSILKDGDYTSQSVNEGSKRNSSTNNNRSKGKWRLYNF